MNTHNYPGRGLSLSQLVFALNEELKRMTYSPFFTLDAASEIERDATIALASIHEWRNSFVPVNRIPTDILSLIPTHLPTQKDRFRAASVCRHWRGVLLKHGTLWSQLFLRQGEECVSTLLERAKGSTLDIITHRNPPVGTITMIAPRAQQIVSLEFVESCWQDILAFSELNSGQLPLLRTLKITSSETFDSHGQRTVEMPPSLRFFKGSINLQQFDLCSWRLSSLSHFIFPNLTTFRLLPWPTSEGIDASCLFDFLKASPMLQTVEMNISAKIKLTSIPQEMVVILPNVKTFSLHAPDGPALRLYNFTSHISCPCAKFTSLTHDTYGDDMRASQGVFPTLAEWNTIVRQYAASPIEEVTLDIKRSEGEEIAGFLTFQSPGAIVVRSGFTIHKIGAEEEEEEEEEELHMSLEEMGWAIFSQALTAIRIHPQLSHVKRLHINNRGAMLDTYQLPSVANRVWRLLGSLGPLDKLTVYRCDLHILLADFLNTKDLVLSPLERPVAFPQVKEFKISYLAVKSDEVQCMGMILELANSQHALGIPFERVTVRMRRLYAKMVEELRQWVATVDCGVWRAEEEEEV